MVPQAPLVSADWNHPVSTIFLLLSSTADGLAGAQPANTSCVTDADCTSISDRYNCFNSFCACVFTEQLSSDPEEAYRDTLTAASGWSLSVRLWTLIIYFTVFVYPSGCSCATSAPGCCRTSYQRLTIIWGVCGSAGFVFGYIVGVGDLLGAQGSELQRGILINLGLAVGSIFIILAALQVSMMWIELCLASKRLAAVSKNLKFTKNIVLAWMVGHVVFCVLFMILEQAVSSVFFLAFNGLCLIDAIGVVICFLIGGNKVGAVYKKHAEAEKTRMTMATLENQSTTTRSDTTSTPTSLRDGSDTEASARNSGRGGRKPKKADSRTPLEVRAARISRTAKTVSIALLVFLLGSFIYIGGFIMDLLALNWLGVILLHTGIAAAHLILRYVDLSLQAPLAFAAADDRRLDRRALLHQGRADRDGAAEVGVRRPRAECVQERDGRRRRQSERERRPSLDDEEEAAMEAKYEAFKAAKEAAEKEAALRASRAP